MPPGIKMIARLDFLAGFVTVQENVRALRGNDFFKLGNPTVKRILLADGLAPGSPRESFSRVRRLRGKVPGQPEDLDAPQAEE
jgi:hypothetical protein